MTEQDIARGERAQALLDNDLLNEAFGKIRSNLHEQFEKSSAKDTEGREEAWKMLKVISEVERHLKSVIHTGKLAKAEKEMESEKQARLKRVHPRYGNM